MVGWEGLFLEMSTDCKNSVLIPSGGQYVAFYDINNFTIKRQNSNTISFASHAHSQKGKNIVTCSGTGSSISNLITFLNSHQHRYPLEYIYSNGYDVSVFKRLNTFHVPL